MKLWKEYLDTRHMGDDFLKWLLIRKWDDRQRVILILVIFLLWLSIMPSLTRWVIFFKIAIILRVLTFILEKIVTYRELKNKNL